MLAKELKNIDASIAVDGASRLRLPIHGEQRSFWIGSVNLTV
jgi:hypothetical protein